MAEETKSEDSREDMNSRLQRESEERFLRFSGLPRSKWGWELTDAMMKMIPSLKEYVGDIPKRYEECHNLMIMGGKRESRMNIACGIATKIRQSRNPFPRDAFGYKHSIESRRPGEEERITWPFTFKIMDVQSLYEFHEAKDREFKDDEGSGLTYEAELLRPDFFILTEVGHEWTSTWTAKLIEDLVYLRSDSGLPIVATLENANLRSITDKHDKKVYRVVADLVNDFEFKIGIEV